MSKTTDAWIYTYELAFKPEMRLPEDNASRCTPPLCSVEQDNASLVPRFAQLQVSPSSDTCELEE